MDHLWYGNNFGWNLWAVLSTESLKLLKRWRTSVIPTRQIFQVSRSIKFKKHSTIQIELNFTETCSSSVEPITLQTIASASCLFFQRELLYLTETNPIHHLSYTSGAGCLTELTRAELPAPRCLITNTDSTWRILYSNNQSSKSNCSHGIPRCREIGILYWWK